MYVCLCKWHGASEWRFALFLPSSLPPLYISISIHIIHTHTYQNICIYTNIQHLEQSSLANCFLPSGSFTNSSQPLTLQLAPATGASYHTSHQLQQFQHHHHRQFTTQPFRLAIPLLDNIQAALSRPLFLLPPSGGSRERSLLADADVTLPGVDASHMTRFSAYL